MFSLILSNEELATYIGIFGLCLLTLPTTPLESETIKIALYPTSVENLHAD